MKKPLARLTDRHSIQYLIAGALFGLLFPFFATFFLLLHEQLPITRSIIIQLHATRPLLLIINTAPVFLGIFATVAGLKQETVMEYNRSLQAANKRLALEIREKDSAAARLKEGNN
ncbi:MAG: hypothetical protein WA958_08935 [Tunicatimonas sp.]